MEKFWEAKAALRFARFFLAVLVFVAAVRTADASPLLLVKNGVTRHTIVLASGASLSEKHAAEELQKFIQEMSGAKLPIVDEDKAPKSRLVVIGRGKVQERLAPGIAFDKLGDEGFALRRVGDSIVIAGGRLRGTMYGIYYLLDEVLGCRWYTSFVSKIPESKTIRIDRLDIVSRPDFEYRQPFYSDAFDADWAARNRTNGGFLTRLDAKRGGSIAYNHFCHTFEEMVPPGKYYQAHPEYYALTGGVRAGGQFDGQLCLTNPDVLKIATETVLQWIAASPELKIVSVSQNDNRSYCHCPNCAAVDAEEGSPSGLMLRFVNAIADEVARQYPDILIDTFAYQYTERPPKITKPRANVRVRLCPIDCCEHHPYETCPQNADFMSNLRGWDAITDNLYIWHYNTNFANYLLPMPDFEQLPLSLRLYKRSGVKGVFCQGTYTAGNCPAGGGGWMDNLKAYIQAKMLWNTTVDPSTVRKDFMQGFFGKAWQPIDQYVDLIQNEVVSENIHGGIFESVARVRFLPPDIMVKCNALFDEAEKLADSPDVLARVKHARLSVRYVEVSRQAEAAASSGTPEQKQAAKEALQVFVNDCIKDGITNFSEVGPPQAWLDSKLARLE